MFKLKEINFESNVKLRLSKNNVPAYSTVIRCDDNLLDWIYDIEFNEIPTEQQLIKIIEDHTLDYASVIPYVYTVNDKKPFIKCDIDNSIVHYDDYEKHGFEWDEVDKYSTKIELFNYDFKEIEENILDDILD